MKTISSMLILISLFFSCKNAVTNLENNSIHLDDYTMTFYDDFDSQSLNDDNWMYCAEVERQEAGGWWKNECSSVENGNYVITCKIDDDGRPVSGGIKSAGRFDQTCGLFNIRFKADKADGLWYAFWLMSYGMGEEPGTVGNGACDGAELDIFELVPGAAKPKAGEFAMSVHWDDYGKDLKSHCDLIRLEESFYNDYHEVWYLWDENGYKLYLDGLTEKKMIFDFPAEKIGSGSCQVPCYMIISAEYGDWGGQLDENQLPAHFYVDYVKVYKKN